MVGAAASHQGHALAISPASAAGLKARTGRPKQLGKLKACPNAQCLIRISIRFSSKYFHIELKHLEICHNSNEFDKNMKSILLFN
jgi:hypothetical protein